MVSAAYERIDLAVSDTALQIFGSFNPDPSDRCPDGGRTLIMLGPREPGFWPLVSAEPEFTDNEPDPLDRWSRRIIDGLARQLRAKPVYPFGGPPYHPFFSWALRTGRCWQSPVQFLVHDVAGLFVSYRGALLFSEEILLPAPNGDSPCQSCRHQPCRTACPVEAVSDGHYDATACRSHVGSPAGTACLDLGCQVRRSCPVSESYGRLPAQSRFHQAAFLRR